MERRTIALLVVIVAALATWAIAKPKPTRLVDPDWDCPRYGKASSWDCVKKNPFSPPARSPD